MTSARLAALLRTMTPAERKKYDMLAPVGAGAAECLGVAERVIFESLQQQHKDT